MRSHFGRSPFTSSESSLFPVASFVVVCCCCAVRPVTRPRIMSPKVSTRYMSPPPICVQILGAKASNGLHDGRPEAPPRLGFSSFRQSPDFAQGCESKTHLHD